jgi:putative transposase
MIDPGHPDLSVRRQCELVGLNRSSYYYAPARETEFNLMLMRQIDELYLKHPFLGARRMARILGRELNVALNRKRVQRLMRKMGIEAIYPGPKTSQTHPDHKIYPYLLRNVAVERPWQVLSTDITYIPMARGFIYLVAVMDWFSRFIISWKVSNSMDASFCIGALEAALRRGTPEIFNTDQGAQFTSPRFTSILSAREIQISMDGRGRAIDNIWIERFWRSLKYEEVYLKDYEDVPTAVRSMQEYIEFYNFERPHQSLGYDTPAMHFHSESPQWQLDKPLRN